MVLCLSAALATAIVSGLSFAARCQPTTLIRSAVQLAGLGDVVSGAVVAA